MIIFWEKYNYSEFPGITNILHRKGKFRKDIFYKICYCRKEKFIERQGYKMSFGAPLVKERICTPAWPGSARAAQSLVVLI
jgi:hypothetical protein